jgi:hypothetical protein
MSKYLTAFLYVCVTVSFLTSAAFSGDLYDPSMVIQAQQPAKTISADDLEVKLAKVIVVDYEAQKLGEVLNNLATTVGVDMYIDWVAMENVGVEKDMPISLHLKNATAGVALDMILEKASANNELDPVWHDVTRNIIHVSTKRNLLMNHQSIIIYDVNDLIPRTSKPVVNDSPDSGCMIQFYSDEATDILELIRTQTGSQHMWVEFGGDSASVREFNGKLIVKAHPSIQLQVDKLLTELRDSSTHAAVDQPLPPNHPTRKLSNPISIDMHAVKLKEALEYIAQSMDVVINVDWQSLAKVGVEPNLPITLSIKNTTTGSALDLILEQASAQNNLDPIWHDETPYAIDISTKRQLLRKIQQLVSYNIRDFIPSINQDDKQNIESATEERNQKIQATIALIRDTFSPHIWKEYGGDIASIRELNGILLIRAHPSIHQQIAQLLTALRHKPSTEPAKNEHG